MTTSQIIILLDVARGFSYSRHLETVDSDLQELEQRELIHFAGIKGPKGVDYRLTPDGDAMVFQIRQIARSK
jgi:hypothetical protein